MSDALKDAQKLYQESLDAMRDQRIQIEQDLRFSDPSDPQQWDEATKIQREGDPGGKRPCLVMDQTGQYVANVAGNIEKQPPAIHAIPVGGGADKKAAEQIDGRFRHIEHASRAAQHYARALTSAARTGVGYLTVRPVYVDRALGWQEPRIGSEPDPLKVVFDPWSVETDGSDATDGFVLTSMSIALFNAKWKGKDALDFGDPENTRRDNNRKSLLIAEHWGKSEKTRNVIVYFGYGRGIPRGMPGSRAAAPVHPQLFRQVRLCEVAEHDRRRCAGRKRLPGRLHWHHPGLWLCRVC